MARASEMIEARRRARQRRVAAEAEAARLRAEREERVDEGLAEALVTLDRRTDLVARLEGVEQDLARTLTRLRDDVPVEEIAELCELDVAEVRRLLRMNAASAPASAIPGPTEPVGTAGTPDGELASASEPGQRSPVADSTRAGAPVQEEPVSGGEATAGPAGGGPGRPLVAAPDS